MKSVKPLVYDVGMNNGDDTVYYLKKGYRVIAIDAHPELCEVATEKFSEEIKNGDVTILNVGVGSKEGILPFYMCDREDVVSTFIPQDMSSGDFRITQVPVRTLSSIINYYGQPVYLKVDIEGGDIEVLKDILSSSIRPQYISAEVHHILPISLIAAMGYQHFKLVPCHLTSLLYTNHPIACLDGEMTRFSFKHHSSGPFGEDLPGDWMNLEQICSAWLQREEHFGRGWFDVHAKL